MKVARFAPTPTRAAVAGLLLMVVAGVAICLHAMGVLAHVFPKERPIPPAYPAWTAIHFTAATVLALLAPWQFWTALRRRRPDLHRLMGRIAAAAALFAGASGIAMAYLPERPVAERVFMTTLFAAFLVFLGRGVLAARRRDIDAHRAWMTRMSAAALTPLTQRMLFPVLAATIGIDGPQGFWELFVSAAWLACVVNFTVAECWLRRPSKRALPSAA
jgi:uncharacterized membrane protein